MTVVATRRYEQRLRAEEAERTRRRILDALRERLREAPAEPVSMNQIARMARVARSTVYLVFGSRPGLFGALGADIMDRGGFGAVPESAACPDAAASLRDGIRAVVGMYASQRDVLRALHSMAQLDAEGVGGSVQKLAQGRATGMAARARLLAEQGALRPDVNEAQAADLLWLLTSFDSFDALYTGRSLPAEQVAEMLIAAAERTLCGAGGFAEAGREGGHDPFGIITGAVETAVRSVLYPGAERAAQGRGGQRGADR
jgi:AcrR family transcriptional regulator